MPSQDAFLNVERGLVKWSRKRKGQSCEDSWAKPCWVLVAFDPPFISGCCVLLPGSRSGYHCCQLFWVLARSLILRSFFLLPAPPPPCGYSPGLSLTGKLASWCQCLLRMPCLGWAEPHPETGAPGPCPALPHRSSWGAAVHAHQEHLETNSILTVGLQGVAGLKVIRGTRARYHGHVAGEKGADGGLSSQDS